jgi:ribosome biogenesis GTPase
VKGLVIKNTGSWYTVLTDDGQLLDCKVKGNFRIKGIRSTNPVAVGDRVTVGEGNWITEIEDRRNYIIRKSINLSKQSHILAANVDQALLVITVSKPETSTTFIDRFLASAEAYRVPVILIFNKTDLLTDEDKEYLASMKYLYEGIGYMCREVSSLTGAGVDELRESLNGKISLFSGNSGVGKSTLINSLLKREAAKTGEISSYHDKGMHTTTFSEMYELDGGGYIIDTPGIKGFGTVDFKHEEVSHFFPEIFKESENCRFNNCTHVHEPGCAVLKAVEEHRISESRYASYRSVMEDEDESKYRERER